jgi:hypothetical protein
MANTIADMLAMETAEPDATLTPIDVFEEKSKDADDAVEYGMGLSQEELFDIAMSVTPMGRAKAGKGAISFLKGLLGRAKSKAKFPVGYGEPTKNISKYSDEFTSYLQQHEKNISGLQKSQKNIQKLLKEYETLEKPTGMRKVGVRVKD